MNALRCLSFVCMFGLLGNAALAQSSGKYDPGASDSEIKIGQTCPYSGPLSSVSELGLTEAAYIAMINERGGINGRKVTFISLDDNYSPAKTIEQTRKLVEQDEVLAIFNPFGTPTATATQKYLNSKKVPQLFAGTGSSRFNDPAFPWSSSVIPSNLAEGVALGKYVAQRFKTAKVAILFQNDDFGKDYAKGFKDAIASSPGIQIVKEVTYEVTEPTIDSQITQLAATEADVLLNVTAGRAAVQSIRTLSNLKWKPLHLLNGKWANMDVFEPVGTEKAVGIISYQYIQSAYDPTWETEPAALEYKEFMNKYRPGANLYSAINVQGYLYGRLLVHILREAGNNLTRENINSISMNLHDVDLGGLLLPGVKINTSPTQRHLISNQILTQFDGKRFVPIE